MIHRVVRVLLVGTLVSAGGSTPFAHIHPRGHDHGAPRAGDAPAHSQSAHHQGQGAHWHLTGRHVPDAPGTNTLGDTRPHDASVALPTAAVERLSVGVGATPALVEMWAAGIVPDPSGRPMPVAANARPNPPPRIVLGARAPPV